MGGPAQLLPCTVDGCDRRILCRGVCQRHYYRLVRYGDPTFTPDMSIPARFWPKVEKSGDGCWRWTGALNNHGYGMFWFADRDLRLAHRVSYEMANGPVPQGLELDHLCSRPTCVNPDHLEAVTSSVNKRRGYVRRWMIAEFT